MLGLDEENCWQAVLCRERDMDGCFVFAVRSTGIFCRPSCPAKRPKREHVEFFSLWREAERAGYRACKRCQPKSLSQAQKNAAAVELVARRIEEQLASGEPVPSLDELSQTAGLSKFHLQRLFKASTGLSPKAYAKARKDETMRENLRAGVAVTQAAIDAGLSGPGEFYARVEQILGMKAAEYRNGGRWQRMWLAFASTNLGRIAVAGTRLGVSAIRFGDDDASLRRELMTFFPQADWVEASAALDDLLDKVVHKIEFPQSLFELPLDLQGTVFQEKVWRALREIAPGETFTYAELADAIGMPKASRAVANACGANPVAVAIPCHRVVRSDGSAGGYRWGQDRKLALLRREGAAAG